MILDRDTIDMLRTILTDPGVKLGERPDDMPAPTIATIREVDIDIRNNKIDAKYSKANYEVDLSDVGGLSDLLVRLSRGQVHLNDDATPKRPYKSQLSLQNEKYCYVILILSGKNWQFSHDKHPFSIGLESTDPPAYYEPRKVDGNGVVLDRDGVKDGCRIAYFIADGPAANSGTPGVYEDPFNLHLELIDRDSEGRPSRVPIIIDPDVRYPGGSGEEEP